MNGFFVDSTEQKITSDECGLGVDKGNATKNINIAAATNQTVHRDEYYVCKTNAERTIHILSASKYIESIVVL